MLCRTWPFYISENFSLLISKWPPFESGDRFTIILFPKVFPREILIPQIKKSLNRAILVVYISRCFLWGNYFYWVSLREILPPPLSLYARRRRLGNEFSGCDLFRKRKTVSSIRFSPRPASLLPASTNPRSKIYPQFSSSFFLCPSICRAGDGLNYSHNRHFRNTGKY